MLKEPLTHLASESLHQPQTAAVQTIVDGLIAERNGGKASQAKATDESPQIQLAHPSAQHAPQDRKAQKGVTESGGTTAPFEHLPIGGRRAHQFQDQFLQGGLWLVNG